MIDNYYIIENCNKKDFEDYVIRMIGNGWELQGGVSIFCIENENTEIDTWYHQAMIHRVEQTDR